MKSFTHQQMRFDLQVIASWIEPGSKVLDLGCGSGDLLEYLIKQKHVIGTGIERRESKVAQCIGKGLSVLQGDISEEVEDYKDNTFDYAILSQTLQQVYNPDKLIKVLLRISSKVIVSFPNFSNWFIRLQVLFAGRAPTTRELPFDWYETPNIRVITINDFRRFAKSVGFAIVKEVAINTHHHDLKGNIVKYLPNLRASYGIFLIGKDKLS
jgi:methionine biosynthesis protein MetW